MLRKDYIMRMVEQIQRAIAEVLLRRKARDQQAAEQLLQQASSEYLGLDFELIKSQPPAQLKALFTLEGELDVGKCIVVGELFDQAAALLQDSGEGPQAESMLVRSLDFFLEGYRVLPDKERSLYAHRIMKILEQLPDREHSVPMLLKIVGAYEAAGKFDSAEDLLFELVEAGATGALERGLELYHQLLGKKDAELEQGGLPREEVQQSLQELKRMRESRA